MAGRQMSILAIFMAPAPSTRNTGLRQNPYCLTHLIIPSLGLFLPLSPPGQERAVRERSEISNRQGELWSGELESRWFYSQAVLLLPPWKSVNHPLLSPPRSKPLPVLGALLISEPASAATAAPATPHLLLRGLLCGFGIGNLSTESL